MERVERIGRYSVGWRERASRFFGPLFLPLTSSWVLLSCIVVLTLLVFYMTFVPGLPTQPGLTLDHWRGVVRPFMFRTVLPNTLAISIGTVAVALFFACPLAWLLNRTAMPFRSLLITAIALPVIIPSFVKGMGWILLVNERIGFVNTFLAHLLNVQTVPLNMNNVFGISWVMGLSLAPTVFFLISGSMQAMDPSLEETAVVVGANRMRTFLHVDLPLVLPATLGAAIYIFMTAISIFETPALIGAGRVPVLSTELFYTVHSTGVFVNVSPPYGAAGVYGILIALPSLLALHFYHRVITKARSYEVITGKAYRPRLTELGRFKYVGISFVLLYLLLAVVLPMLLVVWASLLPILEMPSLRAVGKISLANYWEAIPTFGGIRVITNTVILVSSVTALAVFFSFMVSWIVVRTRLRVRYLVDTLIMLPHAIPGLAYAFAVYIMGILVAVYFSWEGLRGTLLAIAIVHVIERVSYATRITNAGLLQVHHELEECGRVCGAGIVATMWHVMMPLLRPSLIFAGTWTALLTFRDVTVPLFLASSENRVLAVAIWQLWGTGNLTMASAGAVIMVGAMGLILLVAIWLGGIGIVPQRRLG